MSEGESSARKGPEGSRKRSPRVAAGEKILARRIRGRASAGASFPAPPPRSELPSDYVETLTEIKLRVQQERLRTVLAANSAMVRLYWDIGRMILERQERAGWGAKVIDRLAADLREAYPDMKGFSPRNLLFMRGFAATCPDREKVKRLVSRLPWGHVVRLLQRVKDPTVRDWYASRSIQHGWSRSILELQIDGRAYERHGKAVNNFKATLPPADSDMAEQAFKDPYLFDFLGTADPRREREVEQGLVDHVQRFLLEMGAGFAASSTSTCRRPTTSCATPTTSRPSGFCSAGRRTRSSSSTRYDISSGRSASPSGRRSSSRSCRKT